ncbi:hypothetical protein GCM10022225_26810 [Plantactinospora mayteni]|uniref:HTH marR-type domain-containing protein n=1 Tax=Plantactinospora mayteni TaxID=566021 RepID=A0ABQ4EIQ8_9ACTN|nr:helix-turn-helix domain-containing protein [Plantactinospora mayteni]GIG94589.1 hypothetical protein Pma05_11620 [Plantactinospora mayteni]
MDNQKLSPSAKLTLDALNAGPGNVHELSERTGRSRSTTDKAINDLAKAGLIVKVEDGGDPADGAPARWQLADPASADGDAVQPEPNGGGEAAEPDPDGAAEADPATPDDPANREASPELAADAQPADAGTSPEDGQDRTALDGEAPPDMQTAPDGEAADQEQATSDGDGTPAGDANPDGEKLAEAEPPKLCRGCQAQMPKICECCWQKTPAYCGTCRRNMPQVRRGEPGEPVILSNGLPKLRPGELEAMVEKVMREQPMPAFAGIVGWTGGRLAVHIPGRSPGAMTNAMRKFAKEGKAELIGDDPERYKLIDAAQPDATTDTNGDTGSDGHGTAGQQEAGQPDAATEPQPDNAG